MNKKERYKRSLSLPGWSPAVQEKLENSSALVVGAGGLGSPVLYYLTATGVGRIGLMETDTVDLSNLQRQILYTTDNIGQPKGETAVRRLKALNPNTIFHPYPERLIEDNAAEIISNYDIVVDCTDNLTTRRLIHRTCRRTGKPWVHGAIGEYYGQVTTFLPQTGPCWCCLYGDTPDREPGELGVFGPVAGVIGCIQAAEAIKVLTKLGEPLSGRLLVVDAVSGKYDQMRYTKREDCPDCA